MCWSVILWLAYRAFSWLMIEVGGLRPPLEGGSRLYKKAGWRNHEKQVRKWCSSIVPVWLPVLMSLSDRRCKLWAVSWNMSFPHQVALRQPISLPFKTLKSVKTFYACLCSCLTISCNFPQFISTLAALPNLLPGQNKLPCVSGTFFPGIEKGKIRSVMVWTWLECVL